MKKLVVLSMMILIGSSLFAQKDNTLVSKFKRFGVFGEVNSEFDLGKTSLSPGVNGAFGFIFGDLFLGGYGSAITDNDLLFNNEEIDFLELVHTGIYLGYSPIQHSILHPTFNMRAGWGAANARVDDFEEFEVDNVFVVTPEAGLEVNLTRWLRLSGTVGYRFVDGIDKPSLEPDYLNNYTARVGVKIGFFGRGKRREIRNEKTNFNSNNN